MYKRILIATDGSELAGKGVEQGVALAASLQAEVLVVTVTEPVITGYDDALGWSNAGAISSDYQKARAEDAQKILGAALKRAAEAGVKATSEHLSERYAADAIIETAEKHGSDLIVMTSHGRRGLGRLLLGSQTNEVLAHSKIPVLVIR